MSISCLIAWGDGNRIMRKNRLHLSIILVFVRTMFVFYSDVAGAQDTVAAYSFDEGIGSTANDASGNGNDGSLVGAAWAPGFFGNALMFDGVSDHVDIGTLDVPGNELTISFWMKAASFDNAGAKFISKAQGPLLQDQFWTVGTIFSFGQMKLAFRLRTSDGTTSTFTQVTGGIETGVWTYVTATYDGSFMTLYKNGNGLGGLTKSGVIATDSLVPVWIGNSPAGLGSLEAFDGIIDEVRIYNRALNQSEIQQDMNTSIASLPPNNPPEAMTDTALTEEDVSVDIDVLANDLDVDGDALTVMSVTQGTNGTVTINPDSTLNYAPNPDHNGADQFTYTAADTGGLTSSASVTVFINPVNDAPVANDATFTVFEGGAESLGLSGSDVDADDLTFFIESGPSNGTLGPLIGNTVLYTPNEGYSGPDSLTFSVDDGQLSSPTAQADIDVIPRLAPLGNSMVTVDGSRLLLSKRLPDGTLGVPRHYKIKGVNWSPAGIGTGQGQFLDAFEADIPLMKALNVNTIRVFQDFGTGPEAIAVLDKLYANGIMVIVTVDGGINDRARISAVVPTYKDHPAVLMWSLGNEWNLNNYFGTFTNPDDAAVATQEAAALVKSLDVTHPVSSTLGTIRVPSEESIATYVQSTIPDVDVWGLQIYEGYYFGDFQSDLFEKWRNTTQKPTYFSEFGTDAYDHEIAAENQPLQADFVIHLWDILQDHMWSDDSLENVIGGLVFEFQDEWWKNGSPSTHDVSFGPNGGHPDGFNDEEWFGVLDIERNPRLVYADLQDRFRFREREVNITTDSWEITSRAGSVAFSPMSKNGQIFLNARGGGQGGRGINVAVVNPDTGQILDVENFSTWPGNGLSRGGNEFLRMLSYLSDDALTPPGSLVLVGIADAGGFMNWGSLDEPTTYWARTWIDDALDFFESVGSTEIRNFNFHHEMWAMIYVKVAPVNAPFVLAEARGVVDFAEVSISASTTTNVEKYEVIHDLPKIDVAVSGSAGAAVVKSVILQLDPVLGEFLRQGDIHDIALSNNLPVNQGLADPDIQGVASALNTYAPSGYSFEVQDLESAAEALAGIAERMSADVPGVDVRRVPVIFPAFGSYQNWMTIVGIETSVNPQAGVGFVVTGVRISDPAISGFAGETFVPVSDFLDVYFLPVVSADSFNGRSVSITSAAN